MNWNRLILAVTVSKTPDRWIVMAIMGVITGLLISSVVKAADEAPTPSPTVQEEKATPAESGQVQERTVSLTQAVHFTDAKGQDVVVGPGSYQVDAEGTNRIRLVPGETGESVVIEAVSFTHQQTIESPVPVTVPDPQQPDVLHLALLLPGGQGVGAIGTYSGVKPRDASTAILFAPGTVASTAIQGFTKMSLISLTPNHGPSGTLVYVKACAYPPTDQTKTGTLSIGGKQAVQQLVSHWCAINPLPGTGMPTSGNPQSIVPISGAPGPVTVRLDVPGSSSPVESATFTIDPGPAFVLSPRWKIVFGAGGILDRETGLVWDRFIPTNEAAETEYVAADSCMRRRIGARMGWRLPNTSEIGMLLDASLNPGLPSGHPFSILNPLVRFWLSDKLTRMQPGSGTGLTEEVVAYSGNLMGGIGPTVTESRSALTSPAVAQFYHTLPKPFPKFNVWCVRGPGGVPIQ